MAKNKLITYNAQGNLILDNNLQKYINIPDSSLFSPKSDDNDDSYYFINNNSEDNNSDDTIINRSINNEITDSNNIIDNNWNIYRTDNIILKENKNGLFNNINNNSNDDMLKLLKTNEDKINNIFTTENKKDIIQYNIEKDRREIPNNNYIYGYILLVILLILFIIIIYKRNSNNFYSL